MTFLQRFWKVRVCEACNTIVGPADKVPHPGGRGFTQTFYRCPSCDRYHEYAPFYSRAPRRFYYWLWKLVTGGRPRFSNSNEDRHGNEVGSMFWHGRSWIPIRGKLQLNCEWVFGRKSHFCGAEIEIFEGDSNDSLGCNFGLWKLFSFYFELEGAFRWMAYGRRKRTREYGVKFHDGSMWVEIGSTPWEWNSSDKWYETTHTFHIADWILGQTKFLAGENQRTYENVPFPMPERVYRGKVVLSDDVWKNRLGRKVIPRAHIEMYAGEAIPHPGKGENSWDCDEDATSGMTCPAKSLDDAIAAMVGSVMNSRRRHGGSVDWRPAGHDPVGGAPEGSPAEALQQITTLVYC